MGVVYRGYHERLDRPVAVKLVLPDKPSASELAERFQREVQALGRLHSPYVAEAYDADVLPTGELYLVMEFLEGRDLRAEVRARGRLPIAEAVTYIVQACRGAAAAHAAGVVHRDLKPQNLFLSRAAELRRTKLVDFGIARILGVDGSLTHTQSTLGTPLYMSPEQIHFPRGVDARSDVWSLGATLYELLAGFAAFGESTPGAILLAVTLDDPAPLREANPEVPAALEEVVVRALAKEPAQRWQSASEMADRLEPFALPEADLLHRALPVHELGKRPARARPKRRRVGSRSRAFGEYAELVDSGAFPVSASMPVDAPRGAAPHDSTGPETAGEGATASTPGELRLSIPSPGPHGLPAMFEALPLSLLGEETVTSDAAPGTGVTTEVDAPADPDHSDSLEQLARTPRRGHLVFGILGSLVLALALALPVWQTSSQHGEKNAPSPARAPVAAESVGNRPTSESIANATAPTPVQPTLTTVVGAGTNPSAPLASNPERPRRKRTHSANPLRPTHNEPPASAATAADDGNPLHL
jgi:serine/threonine-protein kinase